MRGLFATLLGGHLKIYQDDFKHANKVIGTYQKTWRKTKKTVIVLVGAERKT